MLLSGGLVVRLSQVASVLALGLKPHLEPSFVLRERKLAEVRVIPHGHPVQHDDHHTDSSEDDTARVVDDAFRRPAARNQRSNHRHERRGPCERENCRREARIPLLLERLRSCSGSSRREAAAPISVSKPQTCQRLGGQDIDAR